MKKKNTQSEKKQRRVALSAKPSAHLHAFCLEVQGTFNPNYNCTYKPPKSSKKVISGLMIGVRRCVPQVLSNALNPEPWDQRVPRTLTPFASLSEDSAAAGYQRELAADGAHRPAQSGPRAHPVFRRILQAIAASGAWHWDMRRSQIQRQEWRMREIFRSHRATWVPAADENCTPFIRVPSKPSSFS